MAVTPEGCVHYLVAVNETETSKHGFYTALNMMDRQRDTLALICVLPSDDRDAARAAARGVLRPVAKIAKDSGVKNVAMVASISSHPGLAICNYCLEQSIDVLCLGAADAPKPTSNHDFSTSISLYCVERAPCSVVVARSRPPV